jgi:hypothetical protein
VNRSTTAIGAPHLGQRQSGCAIGAVEFSDSFSGWRGVESGGAPWQQSGMAQPTMERSAYPLAATVPKAESFYVDKVILPAYRLRQLGVLSVKYLRGTIVVFGILLISVLSTVPRVDDQATAYNETDTPINSVSIARIARTNLIMVERPVTVFRGQRECCDGSATMYAITVKRALPASYARLNLLCTLLC